jgi:hypothetical protein
MQLTLDPEDVELLERLLRGRLGELRMEIANLDASDCRQSLKADEARPKALLERLEGRRRVGDEVQPPGGPGAHFDPPQPPLDRHPCRPLLGWPRGHAPPGPAGALSEGPRRAIGYRTAAAVVRAPTATRPGRADDAGLEVTQSRSPLS